ncbi:MAG: GspH/FimT family protein [Desulfosalsimonadaceae bacterium]
MKKQDGFTLIELMIAIAIIAILSAVAVPNYIRYRNNQQVILAAREIYSALQSAKMSAIRDNTAINVLFTPGQGSAGTYQVFEDLDGDNAFDPGERDIANGVMPPGVNMQSAVFGLGANFTRFTAMGLTTGRNGTVIVDNGNPTIRTRVRVNTVGGIRVELDQ